MHEYSDDNAASGAVAVQGPETSGIDTEHTDHPSFDTALETTNEREDVSEASDGEENAAEGDSGPNERTTRPADGDPV